MPEEWTVVCALCGRTIPGERSRLFWSQDGTFRICGGRLERACRKGWLAVEYGQCDSCNGPYPLASREGRCGDCGDCGECCPHVKRWIDRVREARTCLTAAR